VKLFLVHHADAVGPEVDTRRPLSPSGEAHAARLAEQAAARGAKPVVVWHSGKLRARQTALAFWRACNALAEFSAAPDLQPDDPPSRTRNRLTGETRDVLVAGHFPHLPRLLSLLVNDQTSSVHFPQHGVVALESDNESGVWNEIWRLG
jgi:phosphohistidine phosphatase